MPSELTKSVRSAINAFVSSKTSEGEHLPADILRIVRDEASNLLERQLICDALDADPYKLCEDDKDVRRQIKRLQKCMNVSCSRTKTLEGHVNIHSVVELSRDDKMNANVKECIRLEFTYDRSVVLYYVPSVEGTDGSDDCGASMVTSATGATGGVETNRGTRVMYNIDYSKDHGKKERLIKIEVMASGVAPSAEQAIPMEDDDSDVGEGGEKVDEDVWEDYDEDGEPVEDEVEKIDEDEKSAASRKTKRMGTASSSLRPANDEGTVDTNLQSLEDVSLVADGKDRYAAYVDPEALYEFLSCCGLVFDEATSVYFLMTFPFFEHEWDLLGFLLDAVFGGDGEDSGEEEEMDSDGDDNR